MTGPTQPTLPGLETDRKHYVAVRLASIARAIEEYERNSEFWLHSLQSCPCADCTRQRAIRRERERLETEVEARQARTRTSRAGQSRPQTRPAPAPRVKSGPEPRYDYHGRGESGSRPGWDYWDR